MQCGKGMPICNRDLYHRTTVWPSANLPATACYCILLNNTQKIEYEEKLAQTG